MRTSAITKISVDLAHIMLGALAALLFVASVAHAAPPYIDVSWIPPSGGESVTLKCGTDEFTNQTPPVQLTDDTGNFLICGDGQTITLHLVNIWGEGPAGNPAYIGVPSAGPAATFLQR